MIFLFCTEQVYTESSMKSASLLTMDSRLGKPQVFKG